MFIVGGLQGFLLELPILGAYPQVSGVDMSNPLKMLGLVAADVLGPFLFALVYALVSEKIPGQTKWQKGINLGIGIWAVGTVPWMFWLYSLTALPPILLFGVWFLGHLAKITLVCLPIAVIYKED
jgi:hypothetical protein